MSYGAARQSESEQIKAEMKLLNWHKLANDAALKAALIKTKQMKEADARRPTGAERVRAQAAWMQRVIEEEQAKPLQVSKDFVLEYQARERTEEERLDAEVNRHIDCLKKLRGQIEARESLRAKKEAYRRAKAQMRVPGVPRRQNATKPRGESLERKAPDAPEPHGTLTTVISSLDRLVDLERRIASLEKDSLLDRVDVAAGSVNSGASSRRSGLSFTRQRVPPTTTRPSRDVYAVRLQPKQQPLRRQHHQRNPPARGGRAAPAAVSSLRDGGGATRRQDEAIDSWLKRKQQRDKRVGGRAARGAAAGRRGRNAHEQAFLDLKRTNQKRSEKLRGANPRRAPTYKASTTGRRGVPRRGGDSLSRTRGGDSLSRTSGPRLGGSRMPRVQGAGGAYRQGAARRAARNGGRGGMGAMPHIAGSGVRGARGVRRAWG